MNNSFSAIDEFTMVSKKELEYFEGPEKNLEMDFKILDDSNSSGCRQLTRDQLNRILHCAKCVILSKLSNEYLDSYVLSESSLFIYKQKIIIKTCGTTTLLHCLPLLLAYTTTLGLQLEWLGYSRKNYIMPQDQLFPHTSFRDEVCYLDTQLPKFPGSAYVLGPVTKDHWLMYIWDDNDTPNGIATEVTIHLLMQDIHPDVAKHFYHQGSTTTCNDSESQRMTKQSSIYQLVQDCFINDCAFYPCGYSMNAILDQHYHTIHITPESHCSYASWETNALPTQYPTMVSQVLKIFQPTKFTLTVFADAGGIAELNSYFDISNFKRTCTSHTSFEGDYICIVHNYETIKV